MPKVGHVVNVDRVRLWRNPRRWYPKSWFFKGRDVGGSQEDTPAVVSVKTVKF